MIPELHLSNSIKLPILVKYLPTQTLCSYQKYLFEIGFKDIYPRQPNYQQSITDKLLLGELDTILSIFDVIIDISQPQRERKSHSDVTHQILSINRNRVTPFVLTSPTTHQMYCDQIYSQVTPRHIGISTSRKVNQTITRGLKLYIYTGVQCPTGLQNIWPVATRRTISLRMSFFSFLIFLRKPRFSFARRDRQGSTSRTGPYGTYLQAE